MSWIFCIHAYGLGDTNVKLKELLEKIFERCLTNTTRCLMKEDMVGLYDEVRDKSE
jgi:hypothetical protein